ncbi:MAG: uroporphyrinogen decarboxylase family protein [Victivallaceae bacterium]
MKLSPRENLMRLWRRQGYEYAPVHFWICPSLLEQYQLRYCSEFCYHEDFFEFPFRTLAPKFIEKNINWSAYFPGQTFNPGTVFDAWGVGHEPHPGSMHMTQMHHPMAKFTSLEQFQAYPYPENNPADFNNLRQQVEEIHSRGLAVCGGVGSLWENSWYIRSMEELMIDMMTGDEKAVYHFNRVTEIVCERATMCAKAGVDFIHMGDDIGMQHAIMMSEELYREWLKPLLKRLVKAAKDVNPDILFSYHSCGFIEPFIPDLIECGVDILNPIQPECMSFEKIHAEYGDVLSFWGTIGTQTTMPFGTTDDVRREVTKNLKIAGIKGGLLCTPTHLLEPEVPLINIDAYLQACKDFSR